MDGSRRRKISGRAEIRELSNERRRSIGGDRDHSVPAVGHHLKSEGVVAGEDREARRTVAAFVESNPIPAKAGLAMMGKMANVVRLPLVPLAENLEPTVRAALVSVGALPA